MPGDRVTSREVALRAGVSQSAVSRVFTSGGSVSESMRRKVHDAAEALGYRPNVFARAMITGRSRIVALVVASLDDPFYPQAVERLSIALQQEGYHVLVFMASPTVGNVERVMWSIVDYHVDGVVLVSASLTSTLASRCEDRGVPVVLFNRDLGDGAIRSVTADNVAGGCAVAEHLVRLGHRRIGYIAGFEGASTQRDREEGFIRALADAGLALHSREVGGFERPLARHAALEMFAGRRPPDAVFVCNDHMAFAVMDVLRSKLELDVPGDVAVAGFDDVPVAAWPAYDLTSYRQPLSEMVDRAVRALLERIEGGAAGPCRAQIAGKLIARGSTVPQEAGP